MAQLMFLPGLFNILYVHVNFIVMDLSNRRCLHPCKVQDQDHALLFLDGSNCDLVL